MKLTPWLRSLKNGIARTFVPAKPKRRNLQAGKQVCTSGQGAELLEDRTFLNATGYFADSADGVYNAGFFLQSQPGTPIPLRLSPNGVPAIPIVVEFQGLVTLTANTVRPQIYFNTFSNDPTAPNYTGSLGVATYYGDGGTFGSITFWYEIRNGENTAGPTRPALQSYLHVIGGSNGNWGITDGAGAVSMSTLPATGGSAQGVIRDLFTRSQDKFIFIDTQPVVQNIDSTTLDSVPYNIDPSQGAIRRPYRVGDPPISIQVTFSEPVAVSGTPTLVLNTDGVVGLGNNDARAIYKSGSGTNVLTFEYTVRAGDNTSDLDVASNAALVVGTSDLLRDQDFTQDAALTGVNGPSSGGLVPGSLGRNRTIQVDTLAPLVGPRPDDPPGAAFVGVTSFNANGTYGAGQTLTIRVSFNEPIVLTGTPTIVLATGPVNREATFAGFDGTDTLLFSYTVQSGDLSSDLDYVGIDALKLNGGTLTDLAGNNASLTLPAPGALGSLSFNKDIVIDTVVAVTNVTTQVANGSYGIGQVIPIQVVFNKNVTVFGTPQLILDLDAPADSVVVNYSSGSGTNILVFNYTILAGHNTPDLDYISATALQLNGGAIVDTIGNGNAQLGLPLPGGAGSLGFNKNILIDTNLPLVASVSAAASAPDGTYVAGQTIPITVTFNEPVSVTGTPQITLDTNGLPGVQPFLNPGDIADVVVNYSSGSGTNRLTFNYTIAEGQNSLDLDALFLALSNSSRIRDLAGNDIAPTGSLITLPQFANEALTNANLQPNVAPVAQITDVFVGNVVANNVYSFTVGAFTYSYQATGVDTQATVAARLRQAVNAGPNSLNATGFGNSVRITATNPGQPFTVTITPGSQLTQQLITPNGSPQTQIDQITVAGVAPGTQYTLVINGVSLTYTANGTDTIGTVATAIRNLINSHVTLASAVAASSNNGVITVQAIASGTPFTLSTGSSLAGIRNLVIDTAPIVTNVSSPTVNATYVTNDTIAITLTFSEPVNVDTTLGVPSLLLETNGVPGAQPGSDAVAQYNSGTGTKVLTFLYTVLPGQTSVDLDFTSINALSLNGGTIRDQDGTAANLNPALPAPGAIGSLARNKDIQIDDTAKNDPPVNFIPGVQTTTEDVVGGLVFSAANGNLIQVKDVDVGIGDMTVTLTAARGTIFLPNTAGLNTISGNTTGVVTITGPFAAINAALNGLTFQPSPNANSGSGGPISLTISTNDGGNTGTGGALTDTDTIAINVISVNDVPVAVNQTVPTAVNTAVTVFLQATDPDIADNATFQITSQPLNGTLSLISNVNQVVYTPNPGYVGPDSFAFTAGDAVSTSLPGLVTINVLPTVAAITGLPDIVTDEGDSGNHFAVFTVTLSQPAAFVTSIDFATAAGTAIANVDYLTTSGTISFAIGEQTKTINIPIVGDLSDEQNETFFVNLSNAVNVVLIDTQAIGTIQNDDGLSIDDATAEEGDSGTTIFTFNVSLSSPSSETVTVNYSTSNGTASSPSDFTSIPSGSLTFIPGEQTKTVTVTVKGDLLNELDETFFVTLSSPSGASLGKSVGVGTILNDDTLPSVSINDVSVTEGASGTKTLTFTATLSNASGQTVTANYTTTDNTAINGTDYLTSSGVITFAPGVTSVPVNITIIGDQVFEADETFTIDLTNIQGAQAGDVQGIGTITNDDGLSINDVQIIEDDAGTKLLVFTVTAPQTGGTPVSVDFTVTPGTSNPATPNVDYTPMSGTLQFSGGVTSRTISVPIIGDFFQEQSETINVVLTNAVNAPLLKAVGVGTIVDDDATPEITVTDVQIVEGNSGTKNAVFILTLSESTGIPVTVNYQAQSLQGSDNATAGADYVPVNGTVTFQPFQTTATINVPIIGDILDEPTETFRVRLTQAVNASLGLTGTLDAIGTINDDDQTPTMTINDLSVNEGQAGQTTVTFTVSLSAPSGQDITVNYATADGSAKAGVISGDNSSNDYVAQSGVLTFPAGVTSQTITVTVNGDIRYELDETFVVDLSAAVNAGITDAQGTATIANDDAKPNITISDVSVQEGNSGTTQMVFTITLLQESALPTTVNYSTSSGTALDGNDYQSASGTVTFLPGETVKQITVNAFADENVEPDENFFINLSNPTNAVISDVLGVGTIRNDDVLPSVSVNDVSITEGDGGTKQLVFTITRSNGNSATTTVQYSSSNGTATAGSDFSLTQGTVTFLANETTKTVSVPITGDTTAEANETFFLNLSNPTNATIEDGQGVGTILNDDNAAPAVTLPGGPLAATEDTALVIGGISVNDPDSGTASIIVTLTVQHGTLLIRNDVPGGLQSFQIINNGTGSVTLNAPLSVINTTLTSAQGVVYGGNPDFAGTDTLTVIANDLGNTGTAVIPKTDTKSVTINVANVNDAPNIDFHGAGGVGTPPTPVPSTKGNAVAAFGSPNVITLTDPDNTNFGGGTIVVQNQGPFIGKRDKVSVRNQGKGSGQIGFKRGKITYGGVEIGTAVGGLQGNPLVITLNSRATTAATQALLRNITFGTSKARLTAIERTISLVMTDGNGDQSTEIFSQVNVTN